MAFEYSPSHVIECDGDVCGGVGPLPSVGVSSRLGVLDWADAGARIGLPGFVLDFNAAFLRSKYVYASVDPNVGIGPQILAPLGTDDFVAVAGALPLIFDLDLGDVAFIGYAGPLVTTTLPTGGPKSYSFGGFALDLRPVERLHVLPSVSAYSPGFSLPGHGRGLDQPGRVFFGVSVGVETASRESAGSGSP